MVDFLAAVQRPDGLMPQVGDADDGRLHVLSGYGTWQPQDAAASLWSGGRLLSRAASGRALGGEWGAWEAAWWGFDPSTPRPAMPAAPDGVSHFPDAGLTVMRRARDYLLVTNGVVGTSGIRQSQAQRPARIRVSRGRHAGVRRPRQLRVYVGSGCAQSVSQHAVTQHVEHRRRGAERAPPGRGCFACSSRPTPSTWRSPTQADT